MWQRNILLNGPFTISPISDDQSSHNWRVSVSLDNVPYLEDGRLEEPFNQEQEAECRWYLERYLTKSPFDVLRAEDAAEELNAYARNLFEQLQLFEVASKLSEEETPTPHLIKIEILEKQTTGDPIDTVHRFHWEVLESPVLWNKPNLRVVVCRRIWDSGEPRISLGRMNSWAVTTKTINVLLVMARQLVPNAKQYEDVEPNLAYSNLRAIKHSLESRGASVRLNVEIVRPGTFSSLKRHLEETERTRYPGYFHVVHFDVHGQVGLRKGGVTWAAFLYFASARDPEELAATRARAVGQLLRRHCVRVAVLNSCESAKANRGDDANLAKVFAEEGLRNVLAMSFRLQSAAATLFLHIFYESLFAEGKSFSLAVADARESLRVKNIRSARFGIKATASDWIVPVVYVSGEDLQFRMLDDVPSDALAKLAVSEITTPNVLDGSQVIGRDFHVLRFEAIFLESTVVGLTGVAGVGKTAFLKHILSLWKETSFIDDFVYIDGAGFATSPSEQIITDARLKVGTFLDAFSEKAACTCTSQAPGSQRPRRNSAGSRRRVIAIDHVESMLSVLPTESPETKLPLNEIFSNLIEGFMSETRGGDPSGQVTIILVGRGNHSIWQEKHLPPLNSMNRFELGGLELSDAINLAQKLLQDTQVDTTKWKSTDVDVLEQVVHLLQRNPLALKVLLSRQLLGDRPWRDFFEFLHFGQLSIVNELDISSSSGFVGELRSYGRRRWSLAIFSFLGLHWQQGPYNMQIYKFASDLVKGDKFSRFVRLALKFGVKMGFFKLSGTKDTIDEPAEIDELLAVDWIHPLFTVFMRASGSQELFQASFTKRQLATVECLEWSSGSVDEIHPLSEIALLSVRNFLMGMTLRSYRSLVDPSGSANASQGEDSHFRPGLNNIISTLKLCTVETYGVAFDDWLQLPWIGFSTPCLFSLWGPEALTFANHFEMLYKTFLRVNGGFIVEPKKQFFLLNVGNYLCLAHMILGSKRQQEFVQLNMEVIRSSEARYGLTKIKEANYEVATTHSNQASVLLASGHDDEAEEMMKTAISIASRRLVGKSCKEDCGDNCQNLDHVTTPLQSHLVTQFKTSTSELAANVPGEEFEEWDAAAIFRLAWPITKAAILETRGSTSPLSTTEAAADGWNAVQTLVKARGISVQSSPYWRLVSLRHTNLSRDEDLSGRLSALEDAIDHGDIAFTALHHEELLRKAKADFKVDEALQHCDAVIRIYENNPGRSAGLKIMREEKARLETVATTAKTLLSFQVSMLAGEQDKGLPMLESFIECLGKEADLPEGLMEEMLRAGDLFRSMDLVTSKGPRDGSKKRELKKEFTEHLARRVAISQQDPEKAMSDFRNHQRVMEHTRLLCAAWKAGDYEQVLIQLDQVSELNDPEVSTVSESLIRRTRRSFEGLRDWKAATLRVQQAVEMKDFGQAEAYLEEAVQLQASGKLYEITEQHVIDLRSIFELERWSHLVEQIYEAGEPTDLGSRLALIENLFELMSAGCFAHTDKSEREVHFVRLRTLWGAAGHEFRWKDAIDLAQQMVDLYENSTTLVPPEQIADARKLLWISDIKSLHAEILSSITSTLQAGPALCKVEKIERLLETPPPDIEVTEELRCELRCEPGFKECLQNLAALSQSAAAQLDPGVKDALDGMIAIFGGILNEMLPADFQSPK